MVNPILLRNILRDDIELCKLVLFSIEEQIDLTNFLDTDVLNKAFRLLIGNKAIVAVYHENRKYVLSSPLTISRDEITSSTVERIRNVFDKGNTGKAGLKSDKLSVTNALIEWQKQNQDASYDDIVLAAQEYVNNCLRENIIIRQCNRFILTVNDSLLTTWLEEIQSGEEVTWQNQIG